MSVAQQFLKELKEGNTVAAIEAIKEGLRQDAYQKIEEARQEILESYGFVLTEKKKDKTYEEDDSEESDEEEELDEATKKEIYTDLSVWKDRAKELNSKVTFSEEGHGGSKAIVASAPGSSQMVGKFFLGGVSKTKGKGTIYNTGS